MEPTLRRSPKLALLYGAPIGLLGGLIGLGGAEFRLPVLAGVFGYKARRAVALNLAISLITVVNSLLIRSSTLSLSPVITLLAVVIAMINWRGICSLRGYSVCPSHPRAPIGANHSGLSGGDWHSAHC